MQIILFDLDGTLADIKHRRVYLEKTPPDWKSFNARMDNDTPNKPIVDLYKTLWSSGNYKIIIVSGRSDEFRKFTEQWLSWNEIPFSALLMRNKDDYRADHLVKEDKDCRRALKMMEAEKDFETWRILWAGAIALIRAVGHVLDKVDGSDLILKAIAKESFLQWKTDEKHLIFPQFIEMERNNLLKEYSTGVHPLEEVPMAMDVVLAPLEGGGEHKTVTLQDIINLDENIYRPMFEGPWIGHDCRDVYQEAIDWWEQELDLIDQKVELKKAMK